MTSTPTRLVSNAGLPALVFGAALLGTGPADATELVSAYTRHDFQACAEKTSPEPGIIEVRACNGHGGFPVVWTSEPDSSSVTFGPAPLKNGPIPNLDTFYQPRGTVEWRGPMIGNHVRPLAAIVRYDTGRSVSRLASSRLVIYRLSPSGGSCVMGVVKGASPGANANARTIIDRRADGFVCGRSPAVLDS